jgi:hypothetical protein
MGKLSEIARARLTDYQEAGKDGAGYINIGKESPNTAAMAEMESHTVYNKDTDLSTLITKVKFHNPIEAIKELNKLDGLYSGPIINVDNRKIEIIDAKGKLTELINNIADRLNNFKEIEDKKDDTPKNEITPGD